MGKVTVVKGDHRIEVDESSVAVLEKLDYRRETGTEAGARSYEKGIEEEYGGLDQKLLAAGEGFVEGATFDVATPFLDDTATRARKELHPGAHGLGYVGGIVGPAIVTGGGSAAAGGGLKAGAKAVLGATPAGLVARGAEAVAGKVATSRLGHLAVSGAVEGLGQATGSLVSGVIAGDEVTPEALVNELGVGAMLGLGGGVLGRGLEKAAGKLAKLGSVADDVADVAGAAGAAKGTVLGDDIAERARAPWMDSPEAYQFNKRIGSVQKDLGASLDKRLGDAAGELEKWSIGEPNQFKDSHFAAPDAKTGGAVPSKAKKGRQGSNRAGEISNDVVIDNYDPSQVNRTQQVADEQIVGEEASFYGRPGNWPENIGAADEVVDDVVDPGATGQMRAQRAPVADEVAEAAPVADEAARSGRTMRGMDAAKPQEPYVDVRLARPTKQFKRVPEPELEVPFDGRQPTKRIRAVSGDEAVDAAAVADDVVESGAGAADDVGAAGAGARADSATGGGPVKRKKVAAAAEAPSAAAVDAGVVKAADDVGAAGAGAGTEAATGGGPVKRKKVATKEELADAAAKAGQDPAKLDEASKEMLGGVDTTLTAGQEYVKQGKQIMDLFQAKTVLASLPDLTLESISKMSIDEVAEVARKFDVLNQRAPDVAKEMSKAMADAFGSAAPKLEGWSALDVLGYHKVGEETIAKLAGSNDAGKNVVALWATMKGLDDKVAKAAIAKEMKAAAKAGASKLGTTPDGAVKAAEKAEKGGMLSGAAKLGTKAAGAHLIGNAIGGPVGHVLGWAVVGGLQSGGAMAKTVQAAKRKALLWTAKGLGALKGPGRPAAIAAMSTGDKLRTSVSPMEDTSEIKEEQALVSHRIEQAIYMAHGGREALADTLTPMRAKAPEIADSIMADTRRRAEYLARYAPRKPQWAAMMGKEWVYPQDQVDRFAAVHRAVTKPMSVLEDFAAGTLSPDAAAAFRETSPGLYKMVFKYVVDHFDPSTASYNEGFSVSMLTGLPMHPTLMFVPTLQQDFARPMGPQGGGGSAPPVGDPGAAAKYGTDAMASTNS